MEDATPRPSRAIAWQEGRVLPAERATVPLLDDGFQRGDAIFEGVMVRGGRTHALDAHLARLRESGKAMGIRVPVMRQLVSDLLAAWGAKDGALKMWVTRSGTVRGLLSSTSWPSSIALASVEMPWGTPLSGTKTTSYALNQLATRRARELHADDALVIDNGHVLEIPTGAVCWVRDGRIHSPDPSQLPILRSVTMAVLDQVIDITHGVFDLDAVRSADEVFVCSATRTLLPVHALDDAAWAVPGPVTADARERYLAHVDATLDPPS